MNQDQGLYINSGFYVLTKSYIIVGENFHILLMRNIFFIP